MTIPSLLKRHNYHTACIGKWHLGLEWTMDKEGKHDFFQPVKMGPLSYGFDYFFGISASLDMPPYVYIENDRITASAIDTIPKNPGKAFWREGPIGNDFIHSEVLSKMTEKAINYILERSHKKNPFFLYLPFPAPHTPILPTNEFIGLSGTNEYGDFVLMLDYAIGQILKALTDEGVDNNTLVVLTSDNGCSPEACFEELYKVGHNPNYHFRGHKADIYEGGHRIPLIIRWPDKVTPGSVSDHIVCLTDFFATCADMLQITLPDNAGEDSYSMLPVLLGDRNGKLQRKAIVHHSVNGSFSIRQGNWKLIFCSGSGGWSFPTPDQANKMDLPPLQLYNLKNDISEQNNIVYRKLLVVFYLKKKMIKYMKNGRSTPGTL